MRPRRIILIRHGESEANVNKRIYKKKPDFAMNLTEKGHQQARLAGRALKELVKDGNIWFYRSPFYRTRQTHEQIVRHFPESKLYEDPRLREQEHTPRVLKGERDDVEKERDDYGHFYYRFEGGESCADVFDRVSDFLSTLYRDFEKDDFPENACIISHGMTNRVFLMRMLHMTVEEFEFLRNPKNCGFFVLERDMGISGPGRSKFKLTEEPARYPKRNCKY